jgi:hypothetical protein
MSRKPRRKCSASIPALEPRVARVGTRNPERIEDLFWHFKVAQELATRGLLSKQQMEVARQAWKQANKNKGISDGVIHPLWSFRRHGQTQTTLPDGRMLFVAGEHEDAYDRDFFIYNDVVVLGSRWPNRDIRLSRIDFPSNRFSFSNANWCGNHHDRVTGLSRAKALWKHTGCAPRHENTSRIDAKYDRRSTRLDPQARSRAIGVQWRLYLRRRGASTHTRAGGSDRQRDRFTLDLTILRWGKDT